MTKTILTAGCAAVAALMLPGTAMAQTAPAATQAAIDPARLAEAHKMIDVLLPPASRDQIITSMVTAMVNNMLPAIEHNPDFASAMDSQPGAREVFKRFVDRQQELNLADLRANLPAMIDAMSRAYARRFTVEQMHDVEAFFSTPTGRLYMAQAGQVMADPDVAAWQQQLMARGMARMPAEIATLQHDVMALSSKGAPHAP